MNNETCCIDVPLCVVSQNAREHLPEELDSLAADMAKIGQLQEIVVVKKGDRFEVAAGVGRLLAARKLGWTQIRCFVKENLSDFDRLRITFSENEEREDVSPIYQAQLLNAMKGDMTARDLAAKIGKNEDWIASYLGLLQFSPEVQKSLIRIRLNLSQLRALLAIEGDEAQLKAAQEVAGLTKEQTKEAVKKHLAAQGKEPKAKKAAPGDLEWKKDALYIRRPFKPG